MRLFRFVAYAALVVSAIAAGAMADPAADFAQAFANYKSAVEEFEALRTEFQEATEERQAEINAELGNQYSSLKQKVDQMVASALEAYRANPNGDRQVTDLLMTVATHDIRGAGENSQGGDQYERAFEVISALVDGGLTEKDKKLPVYGFVAAFMIGELDKAEEFLGVAQEFDSFGEMPNEKDQAAVDVFESAVTYARVLPQEKAYWAKEREIREAEAAADDLPRVKLTTSKGVIVLELFENEAPNAVGNFVSLVKDGYYDGLIFHRVLPRFMAQGGCPEGSGTGGPGYSIPCECWETNHRKHFRGSLSMAHAGRDTGGSQFFLTFVPTRHLDPNPREGSGHTVFGRVIEGMSVLADLQRINPGQRGVNPDRIVKAEVLRDRGHSYDYKKLPGR